MFWSSFAPHRVPRHFIAWTVILVLKRYRDSGRLGRKEIGQIDLALFLRVLVFSFFILVCLV